MMGSGKTTIGRLLSRRTGWPLADNDELLQTLYGMTPRELHAALGVDGLRQAEDEALVAGLGLTAPRIVDAAGGTILSDSSRRLLRESLVVWLRASAATLVRRSGTAAHRPWLYRGEEWFREAVAHRYPLYESVADLIVDTDVGTPDLATEQISAWLAGVVPCAASLPEVDRG